MKRAIKVSLDSDKSLGFGALIQHCGKLQPINYHAIEPGEWWECVECRQPIVLVTESGWYVVGDKLEF